VSDLPVVAHHERGDRELAQAARMGDAASALAYIDRHKPADLRGLIWLVYPNPTLRPSPTAFDALADAWAIHKTPAPNHAPA
jgi:hypothetical protein